MPPHHYCFASKFLGPFPAYDPVDKGLNKAAAGFAANLLRIQSLGRFPIILLGAGLALQHFDSRAALCLGLMQDDPKLHRESPYFDSALYKQKENIRKKNHYEWFVRQKMAKSHLGWIGEKMSFLSSRPKKNPKQRRALIQS